MKKAKVILLLLILTWLGCCLQGIGKNPIKPYHLNKGKVTQYLFSIETQEQINSKAKVKVTFPSQFDQSEVASSLDCLASEDEEQWNNVPCVYSSDSVILSLGTINDANLYILIASPQNPSIHDMSSYFSICFMFDQSITNCNMEFGKVVFPDSPVSTASTAVYPDVTSLDSATVGKASIYQLNFTTSTTYAEGNTIRVTLPPGYTTTKDPICQMTGTYSQTIKTFVWPNKRSIECQLVNKTLSNNEILKIVGIYNPHYAGVFGNTVDGFVIEILKETTTIVLEEIFLQKTITIQKGEMQGNIIQDNNFIKAKARYTFELNLQNALVATDRIEIRMDDSWVFYNDECSIVSGIQMEDGQALSCTNDTQGSESVLIINNFKSASVTNQQVFNIYVGTPESVGTYTVDITSANDDGDIDYVQLSVTLNSTYGTMDMLSINAITANSAVPVAGTGPLQLTFFFNYELPQTNVLTDGYLYLHIYPQIPKPPELINGVLKCYFYNDIPAETLTWDTSNPDFTLVSIKTPETVSFQYSEIPITLTTEGAVNDSMIGITIDDKVTRYRFELEAYTHENLTTPTEVYYTEYIAEAIELTLTTCHSLTKEISKETSLRIEYTNPYNFSENLYLDDDIRLKIEFLSGGGWADNLGYEPNTIYKRFPCVFYFDNLIDPPTDDENVRCDLYTYTDGPHASLTDADKRGPYILMYGFSNYLDIDELYRLELAKFLIGSSTGIEAKIRFSIIEQTPDMLTKYIELYYSELTVFTTVAQQIPVPQTNVPTNTLDDSQIKEVTNHVLAFSAPQNSYAVLYQYDMESTPSLPNQFVTCSSTNDCVSFGYPVNWVIEYHPTQFPTSISSTLSLTNGKYAGTFSGLARVFTTASLAIFQSTFQTVYTPIPIVTSYFYKQTSNTLYKGAQVYYSLYFDAVTDTPDNGFIRLIFGNGVHVSPEPFCESSQLPLYHSGLGLLCENENSDTTLKIYNIDGLDAGSRYYIKFRLTSDLSTGGSITPTVTIQTYYTIDVDYSIIDEVTTRSINQTYTNYYTIPSQFSIENPKVTQETPRVGYIGKFVIRFNPSSDSLSADQLRVRLPNHEWNGGYWTTPSNLATDPMVCKINTERVPCTYTLSPLEVLMEASGMNSGTDNYITLDTEYLPENGIKHPAQGGQYTCTLSFETSGSSIIQSTSFYHRVLPQRLRTFHAYSAVNDIGVENMFTFELQVNSNAYPRAYADGTTYSRIFFEFPTVDSLGNALFEDDLGGYTETGEFVGCYVYPYSNPYIDSPGNDFRCRLIKSQVAGEPAIVELINHRAFGSSDYRLKVRMARIYNPSRAVQSIPLSVRIVHVSVSTNDVYELYYDTFDLFMNSQTPAPAADSSRNCNSVYHDVFESVQVGGVGWFRFYPRNKGDSISSSVGYYYVLQLPKDIQPQHRQVYAPDYCHGSYQIQCMSFPDINYIIIHSKYNNNQVRMQVRRPYAISQANTNIPVLVWQNNRYRGKDNIVMTPTCYNQFRGTLVNYWGVSHVRRSEASNEGLRKHQVMIDFQVRHQVPAGGTIQIVWPSSVPGVYAHCRSMTNYGSQLTAVGGTYNGEIGCLVQNTRNWVITSFATLAASSRVKIMGYIDMRTTNGYLGTGEVITYNNTHPTDIRGNGFIIDYHSDGNFEISAADYASWNADGQITLEETLPLRVGHSGPLQFKFRLGSSFPGPNSGKMRVRLHRRSVYGELGGFTYDPSKKIVCQLKDILSHEEYGCIVTSVTEDSTSDNENFLIQMVSSSTLSSSNSYKVVINTYTGIDPEGLTYPTHPGTYKVDFNFDVDGSDDFAIHDHLYMEVYGTPFTTLSVTSFVTIVNNENLIWVKLTPTTTITTTDQIVIEVPTKSSAGTSLFADDLGLGTNDGGDMTIDIIGGDFTNTFMKCRLFHGDQSNSKVARIICADFQQDIQSNELLYFAFKVHNPSISPQISIPFFVYSLNLDTMYKTNFNVVEKAVYLRNSHLPSVKSDVGNIATGAGKMQTQGTYIDLITRNEYSVNTGEFYVLFFNFPLRNNGQVVDGCSYPGSTVYGDAWYHQNLWVIVCAVDNSAIGVPSSGYQTRNLRIAGFYSPWFYLDSNQRVVTTYGYEYNGQLTSKGTLSDGYPNQNPKTSSDPSFSMTAIHQTGTKYRGARDDYTFQFTFSTGGSSPVDISYMKKIALIFPTTSNSDFSILGSDCVEAPTSEVEIEECWLEPGGRLLWIRPVIKDIYTSDMKIAVTTRGLAIRNPLSNSTTNHNWFTVKFYSWENISEPSLSPLSNNNYCFLSISNFQSATVSYSSNPSSYPTTTFSYLDYVHQRYYMQVPFSKTTHRAPFSFVFMPSINFATQSGNNYHQLTVYYSDQFVDQDQTKIRDLQIYRPVCYLSGNRIRQCTIDTTNNKITMSFQFSLTINNEYHVEFSLVDPRNADQYGFLPTQAVSDIRVQYVHGGSSTIYYTETDKFPSLFSLPSGIEAGPFRGIKAGSVEYGHTIADKINAINFLLTFNKTDITGLVFEFPLRDHLGQQLFESTAQQSASFMGLQDGATYPCGNNGYGAGGNVKCIIQNGRHDHLTSPTRIIMTDFTYLDKMNCRFIFINPSNTNSFFSVKVKAFGGTKTANNLYGDKFMGEWEFMDIFDVSSASNYYTGTYDRSIRLPSQSPWRNDTIHYVFSRNQQINQNRMSIAQVQLSDSGSSFLDDEFCEAELGSSNNYDDMLRYTKVVGGRVYKYAVFMTTWQSNTNNQRHSSGGWALKYLKCKFYAQTITAYFFFSDTTIEQATNTFTAANARSLSTSGISDPVNKYYDQTYRISDGTDTYFTIEMDLTPALNSLSNFYFADGDQMVLTFTFSRVQWSSYTSCSLLGGVISTSDTEKAYCTYSGNTIIIRNVAGFETDPLLDTSTNNRVKFMFKGDSLGDYTSTTRSITTYLWANYDAYSNNYQAIFYEDATLVNNCYYPTSNTCWYSHNTQYATFEFQELSDTSMRVAFKPANTQSYGGNLYAHIFDVEFNNFGFGSCNLSSIVFEISTSNTPGTGVNNTVSPDTHGCYDGKALISYSATATFSEIWGGQGAASDNEWDNNEYIIMYLTIAPGNDKDLPVYHHEYIYAVGVYRHYLTTYTPVIRQVDFLPTQELADTATLSTISNNRGGVTELSFELEGLKTSIGSSQTNYLLLAQFLNSNGWTSSNDPFATYLNVALDDLPIQCKCTSGTGPLSISTTTPYGVSTTCRRRQPSGSFSAFAILIDHDAVLNEDIKCFFPEFKIATGMNIEVQFKVVYGDSFPPDITGSRQYGSMFRKTSNILSFAGSSPDMSFSSMNSLSQSPSFYPSSVEIGSTFSSTYTISGSWGSGRNTPYVYLNYQKGGPVPADSFCADPIVYSECRVYKNSLNLVIARLKSTSVTSFSMSRGASDITYPSSQSSESGKFDTYAYIGSGQWTYSRTISRSQSNLAPISDNTFVVAADLYGSSRSTYKTNLIISLSTEGKTLFNHEKTGSKISISWSGITHGENCQIWVQNQPQVSLTCIITSNLITVYSLRSDYTTSNYIFISMGITNPTSSSVTFTMKMYDYYYSGSLYSLMISRTATYSIDNTYVSNTEVDKSRVSMLPFRSRISDTGSAPLRVRFKLSTGTLTSSAGLLKLINSKFAHSSTYIIRLRKYSTFAEMIQYTEGIQLIPSSYSVSSTTLSIYPPLSQSLSSSQYYELQIMPVGITSAACVADECFTQSGFQQLNFDTINFLTYTSRTSPTLANQQIQRLYAYEGSDKISLSQIYVLCVEPTETSLYFKFELKFNQAHDYPEHYLEFVFWDLTASAFSALGYTEKNQIPCQLSEDFQSISNREPPSCVLAEAEADNVNSFVKVRIINIGDISEGFYWMTLDDITLPTPSSDDDTSKFDVSIRYMGPSNTKYENYFREVFLIDGTNSTGVSGLSSPSFSNPSVTEYGASVVGSVNFNWPFDTSSITSSQYQSKVAFNLNGGYAATWSSIDDVTFVDSIGTYQLLWVNKHLNKFVFKVQPRGNGVSTTINITSLNNPYPFQQSPYNVDTNVEVNFYQNFFHHSRSVINQPAFSTFTKGVPKVTINQNLPGNTLDIYPSTNDVASGGYTLLRVSPTFGETKANIIARQLDILDIQFTSGVTYIEQCRVNRNSSQYVNPLGTCQTYDDGNWHIVIYGVTESEIDVDWWVQALVTLSSSTIVYTSRLKPANNVVEYESNFPGVTLANYFDSGRSTPTVLSWLNRKYLKNFFENQYRFLEAVAGQTTPYLRFRIRVHLGHNGISDKIRIYLHTTTTLSSRNSNSQLICQLLPAVSAERDFSIGYYGLCTKSSSGGHHYYQMEGPYGGWETGRDYLLQISEPNVVTTMFNGPTSPGRHDLTVHSIRTENPAGTYTDSIALDYYQYFNDVRILHTTTTVDDYDTLTVTYTPKSSVSAFASNRQVALTLSVSGLYHEYDGGISSIFSSDGVSIQSGHRFSEVVSNPNGGEVTTVQFAQYSQKMAPLRFTLARQSAYTAGTTYTWYIPLLKNPSTAYVSLRYNLTLVEYPASTTTARIINHHQCINEYYTETDTSTSFSPTITNSNRNVQVVNGIDLSVNLIAESLAQWDVVTFKLDNSYEGLIQDLVAGNDTSNYNYFYFHTLNMVMAQKKTGNNVNTVGINSDSDSINYQREFKFNWVKIFDTTNAPSDTNPVTLKYGDPPALMLDYLTSYNSQSITLLEGVEYEGSTVMYQLDVQVPIIPLGGQIQIVIDSSKISTDVLGHCRLGTNFVRDSDDSQVMRCYRINSGFRITGFQAVSAGTTLTIFFYVKSLQALVSEDIGVEIYGIYDDSTSSISKKSDTVSISHTADTEPSVLEHIEQLFQPYYSSIHYNNYYEFEGSLTLRNNQLLNGDSIRITDPFTAYGNMRFLIRKNDSNTVEWIEPSAETTTSGSKYRFYLPTNYLTTHTMEIGTQYLWKYTTTYAQWSSSGAESGFIPSALGTHKWWYEGFNGGSVTQAQYYDFVPDPKPFFLTITNRHPIVGKKTVLDFSFGVDVNVYAGDWLQFTFDTNNLMDDMFANELEDEAVTGQTYKYLDCREWHTNSYISNSRMKCLLYYGDKMASPPTPARLIVPLEKTISGYSGTDTVRFMVANVKNPSVENMNVGVQMRIYRKCDNTRNENCALFEARGFYVTKADNQVAQSGSTFAPSSTNILDNSLTSHQFSLPVTDSVTSSDIIYIVYPENYVGQLSDTCQASNYYCYAFPTRRWIVLYPSNTRISGAGTLTITLTNYMNNPYYSQPFTQNFLVTVSRGSGMSTADYFEVYHDYMTTVQSSFVSSDPTALTIEPTQTPDIYLRNYANTAIFTISNIYVDERIKSIYIIAPDEVTEWDADYCNASMTDTQINTYPLRFTCNVVTDNTTNPVLQIVPEEQDFEPYLIDWNDYDIRVHAKFTLDGFPSEPVLYTTMPVTSGEFYVYGSVNVSSVDPKYYLSETSNTIQISQHQVPIISDITFNQKSFAHRVARVNNKEVFYLLLKPTESSALQTIGEMVFEIPVEFDYPGLYSHDNCFMIGRTKEDQNTCSQSRQGGKTLIKITPENYDNEVKIIQLGSIDVQNWFTAPSLPGNFYSMTVEIYADSGTLLEKQTIDISPVYGQYFDIPSIDLQNIRDGNIAESVYDFEFVTGTLQIPPGAATSATTQISEFRFIFESYNADDATNVFSKDLGTGLEEGDEVGCIIHEGFVPLEGKSLKCVLHIGTNSTDKPMITVLNYDYIDPGTTIKISFGGIQSLNQVNVNTISIGVLIHYTDIDSSTYLYIPTPKLPTPTNNTLTINDHEHGGWHGSWYMNAYYTGNNIVRESTTFVVQLRVPYMYPHYDTYSSDGSQDEFILVKFAPKYLIDPLNQLQITCSQATQVEMFYDTGILRFRHTRGLSGSGVYSWTFNNFPSSAYTLSNQPTTVDIQIYKNYRLYAYQNQTLAARTVEKCTSFDFGVISVSSSNGGEIGITYTFILTTNHQIPEYGAISITLPTEYGDFIANQVTCTLQGFSATNAYCLIETRSRVDIYLNGSQLSQTAQYEVILTNLQNPNEESSNFDFMISSYYDNNLYLGHKICENKITPPPINVKSLRLCTLQWTVSFVNKGFEAVHEFVVSCTDRFRGDSILYIELPNAFTSGNEEGDISCTSRESTSLEKDVCEFRRRNNSLLLSADLEATSQTSLSLVVNFVNPTNSTYSASASILSKGVKYAYTENAQLTILSTRYEIGSRKSAFLMNSPKEAGLMATYIFQLGPISTFTPSNLAIQFPDNFDIEEDSLLIGITTSKKSNLFNSLTYDNVQKLINNVSAVDSVSIKAYPDSTVDDNTIFMTNISETLVSNEWTYVFIRGVNNPSEYEAKDFIISYYLLTGVQKSLLWTLSSPLPYKISKPPQYLSIKSVTVSDYDLLYPATYTFNLSGDGKNIGIAGETLSFVVVLPNFYRSTVWANTAPTCKFAELSQASPCESYETQIIVTETFTSDFDELTLEISSILNPELPTSCDTTDITILSQTFFIIRIIEVASNKFMFESSSVVGGNNCLAFESIRIPITLEHREKIYAGLPTTLTYGISKPAANLKIKASIINDGFTFVPDVVEFNDYETLKKTVTVYIRNDVTPGNYTIQFQKYESEQQTYFRNILPITIEVLDPSTSDITKPTITIPEISISTVGYPVVVPVYLSMPTSTTISLFIHIEEEQEQTLEEYSPYFEGFSLTPRLIEIVPQQDKFNFTILHKNRHVPPSLTLTFTMNSVYTIVHELKTTQMTLCFQRDPQYNVLYPPLKVSLTQFALSCSQKDVGKKITNKQVSNSSSDSSAEEIKPNIIRMVAKQRVSTSVTITVNTRINGTIHYLCIDAGYPKITEADEIILHTSNDGITGYISSEAQNVYNSVSSQVNNVIDIQVNKLTSSTRYRFYAVLESELGNSDIKMISFSTTQLSKGVEMKLTFNDVVGSLEIVESLERILRLSPFRIKVITSTYELTRRKNALNRFKNNAKYVYEVVIAPDPTNDAVTPRQIVVDDFVNNENNRKQFLKDLPDFDATAQIQYFELRPIEPKLYSMPAPQKIRLYNAIFTMKLWERSNIYAILVEKDEADDTFSITTEEIKGRRVQDLTDEEKANCPSSLQIRYGKNIDNTYTNKYRKFSSTTDSEGNGAIYFENLKPGTVYDMFITCSSYLPYEPTMLWEDENVILLTFKTLHNPNLKKSNRHIDELKEFDEDLGGAIERHQKNHQRKKGKYQAINS